MLVRLVWSPRKAPFVYPIPPAPRTAVLMAGFRSCDPVRVFPDGWTEEVKQFAPQAVAGSLRQLEALTGRASPSHAVIVMRKEYELGLSDANRTALWKAFRVPAFEQIVAGDGSLVAIECEAHDGLHVESSRFESAEYRIETARCACGRFTPRLVLQPCIVPRRIAG
jgi:hypothetical protein